MGANTKCADCGRQDNTWASVSHGVFICVTCSDVHRSVGTHVTKVKGCTGTYLWGPDELDKMRTVGNAGADAIYGAERINPGATKEQKQQFVIDKYEKCSFVGRSPSAPCKPEPASAGFTQPDEPVVRKVEQVAPARVPATAAEVAKAPIACKVDIPDSLFDELFNEAEDSYFGHSSDLLKTSNLQIVSTASTPCSGNAISLDAFLNSTLQASSQPTSQAGIEADPFFDWPDF